MGVIELTELESDCLKEMANVGGGHAVGVLSQLLDQHVNLNVPSVTYTSVDESGESGEKLVVVYSPIESEGVLGNVMLTIPWESFVELKRAVNNEVGEDISNEEKEYFTRVGEAVINSYAEALNNFLSMDLRSKDSSLVISSANAYVKQLIKEYAHSTLVVSVGFSINEPPIKGQLEFSLVPNQVGYLLQKIRQQFGM